MKIGSLGAFTLGTILAIWGNNPVIPFLVFGVGIILWYTGEHLANKPEK